MQFDSFSAFLDIEEIVGYGFYVRGLINAI